MDERFIVEQLKLLISIQSVNRAFGGPGEQELSAYLQGFFRSCRLDPVVMPVAGHADNVFVRLDPPGSASGSAVLVESHMDTVAATEWERGEPFTPEERDGRLYGRGACDTKGSLAVVLALAKHFAEHPGEIATPVVLGATVDEEFGQGGSAALTQLDIPLRGIITGEPTGCAVVHLHKGLYRCRIVTRGAAAHSASPQYGTNAIMHMGRILRRIERYVAELRRRPAHPQLGQGTACVTTITGGIAHNVVPDTCAVVLDRRLLPDETPATVRSEITALLGAGRAAEKAEVTELIARTGLNAAAEAPLTRALAAAARTNGAVEPILQSAAYMTNASTYQAAGIPALVFGPGNIAQAHTSAEYVETAQLGRAFAILKTLLTTPP